jgi:hypothetical protein
MTTRLAGGFALVLAFGCNSPTKLGPSGDPALASSAIQALTARDEQVVGQCGQAVQRCELQLPDAAPAAVCQKLVQHCEELQQHLSDVRDHVLGCLHGVQACQEHAPEQAQCTRDIATCQPLADGANQDRDTVLQCSDKVQACLIRVASLPAAAAVSCENMAAACERVSALVEEAGRERAAGEQNAQEHAKQAHETMDAVDDEASEEDDDTDAQDMDDQGHHGGAADAGADHPRKAGGAEDVENE